MNNRTERKRIGYAVLGLGIGMAHADAAYASDNADLVAVCDIDEARLHQAEQAYPGSRCTAILSSFCTMSG